MGKYNVFRPHFRLKHSFEYVKNDSVNNIVDYVIKDVKMKPKLWI